ncbi:hypothetical protein O6P43_024586 [Quillaja saponaria]|uniref:Uncharacterized protein n=1 Tax=Quillaja saponaria TaxID=32244 RepID=A0AAD7PEN4_QUISA|nr:hypothetical protein O6P43_024586 [Quillaja saponaria]
MPLHSAVASACLTFHISAESRSCCELSQDVKHFCTYFWALNKPKSSIEHCCISLLYLCSKPVRLSITIMFDILQLPLGSLILISDYEIGIEY